MEKLHTATSELIQQSSLAARQHADVLHREATEAITAQGLRMQELHTKARNYAHQKAIDAIAAQGLRMEELHTRTMDAVATLDREHREKLHTETMTEIAALSERTAVLEAKADRPEPEAA